MFFLVCALHAQGLFACLPLLLDATRLVNSDPISSESDKLIQAHPISTLAAQSNKGSGLFFNILTTGMSVYSLHASADLSSSPEPVSLQSGLIGESIQANFLVTTLMHIFPEAEYISSHDHYYLAKLPRESVGFDIRDVYEPWSDGFPVPPFAKVLPMHLLKAANSRALHRRFSKDSVKEALGIDGNFVVHIYGKVSPAKVYATITKTRPDLSPKDIVYIYSMRGRREGYPSYLYSGDMYVHDFNGLKAVVPRSGKPTVVVNLTNGLMPLLNRASDFAVVDSSINFFESVNNQIPTVVLNDANQDPKLASWYRKVGKATNGVSFADTLESVPPQFWSSDSKAISLSSFVSDGEKVVYERYLDLLEKTIRER